MAFNLTPDILVCELISKHKAQLLEVSAKTASRAWSLISCTGKMGNVSELLAV